MTDMEGTAVRDLKWLFLIKIYGMTAGEEDITDHRPVYILGAGFSKAICNEMPLLNALGQQALNLLPKASRESISFREGESFEQWLSMRTQDMPFLPDHENMRRRAVVELLLAAAIIVSA